MKLIRTGMLGVALVIGAHVNAQTEQAPAQKEGTETKQEASRVEGTTPAPLTTPNAKNMQMKLKNIEAVAAEQKKPIAKDPGQEGK